jgi:hypothetical protein
VEALRRAAIRRRQAASRVHPRTQRAVPPARLPESPCR